MPGTMYACHQISAKVICNFLASAALYNIVIFSNNYCGIKCDGIPWGKRNGIVKAYYTYEVDQSTLVTPITGKTESKAFPGPQASLEVVCVWSGAWGVNSGYLGSSHQ